MPAQGSLDAPPLIIASSPAKQALAALGCVAFVLVGALLVRYGDTPKQILAGWLSAAFFGAIGVLVVIKALRPDRLTIGPDGLRFDTFLGTAVQGPWTDLGPFETWTYRTATCVIFNVSPALKRQIRFQGMNSGLTGMGVALPGGWPMGGEQLAQQLNEAKARWS